MSGLRFIAAMLALAAMATSSFSCRAQSPSPSGYSAPALYNLANSYARAGKPGLAVLNYERAGLLDPRDPDIIANLHYVRETSGLAQPPRSGFDRLARSASPQTFWWCGLAGLLILGSSALARQLYPAQRFKLGVAMGLGAVLIGLTSCNAVALWETVHEAVVITPATPARVSPVPMGEPQFVLREAETVQMRAAYEGYVLVRTRAGRVGWVSRANLAPVVPKS